MSTYDMVNAGVILGSNIGLYLIESAMQLLMTSAVAILKWITEKLSPFTSVLAKILGIFLLIWGAIKLFQWLKDKFYNKEDEKEEKDGDKEVDDDEQPEEKEEVIIKPNMEAQSYDKTNYKKKQPKTTLKSGKVITVPMQKEALDKNHTQEVESLKRSMVIISIEGRESNAIM